MKERVERLKAQRDQLIKMKNEQRQKEAEEYTAQKKSETTKDKIQKGLAALDLDKKEESKYKDEMEKRRALFKNVKDALVDGADY